MEMHTEGTSLIIAGEITTQDNTKFTRLLSPQITTIVLTDSSGGDSDTALNVAKWIRERGLTTVGLGYCRSSCAVMFLGGKERLLANERSYVAFHGVYGDYGAQRLQTPRKPGALSAFFKDYTDGKADDALIELWTSKRRSGFVYFFKNVTYSCGGTEEHRPGGCAKLSVTALDQGIITSLSDWPLPTN